MKHFHVLVALLILGACAAQKAPAPRPPPSEPTAPQPHASALQPPTPSPTGPASAPLQAVAPAPTHACDPITGTHTKDPALAVACDGCQQKYYSNMGLPNDMTFDECVELAFGRVQAKLAADPHRYDSILPKILGH